MHSSDVWAGLGWSNMVLAGSQRLWTNQCAIVGHVHVMVDMPGWLLPLVAPGSKADLSLSCLVCACLASEDASASPSDDTPCWCCCWCAVWEAVSCGRPYEGLHPGQIIHKVVSQRLRPGPWPPEVPQVSQGTRGAGSMWEGFDAYVSGRWVGGWVYLPACVCVCGGGGVSRVLQGGAR
jgi:hypothetical protein